MGYWFKERSGIDIVRGQAPWHITLDAVPAGTLYGRVLESDGTDANNVLVSVQVVEKSPLQPKDAPFLNVDGKNSASADEPETTFSMASLPLGGRYALVVHRHNLYVETEPMALDDQTPIRQVNVHLPKGVTPFGQVVDIDHVPLSGIPYQLDYDARHGGGFSRSPEKTDANGGFSFGLVNPNAPGTYTLILDCRHTYRKVKQPITDFTSPITIQLERGAIVTGRILDETAGWPIPGVTVSAYHSPPEYERLQSEGPTDDQGRFRFSNMKPKRTYHLNIKGCRGEQDVRANETKDLRVHVPPYDWSSLKPQKPE